MPDIQNTLLMYDYSPGLVALKTSHRMCDVVSLGYWVSNITYLFVYVCKLLVCFNLNFYINKFSLIV